jgi:hypothetical protein
MLRWMSKRKIEDVALIERQTDGVTACRIIYETLYFLGAKEKCTYIQASNKAR